MKGSNYKQIALNEPKMVDHIFSSFFCHNAFVAFPHRSCCGIACILGAWLGTEDICF